MKTPFGVQPVQYEAVPTKKANRRGGVVKKAPVSGRLELKVNTKPFNSKQKVKLEAGGPNANDMPTAIEPPILNMSTGNMPFTNLGYPKGYPRNTLNKRIQK